MQPCFCSFAMDVMKKPQVSAEYVVSCVHILIHVSLSQLHICRIVPYRLLIFNLESNVPMKGDCGITT